ncbi:putative ATP-dependent RNA helicase DHX34 [Frankliniella fusca]|uniref:ATP-dependent RNA helicase DHX34 n=1 Tax=Frankliniella fusca TaxID=407009 RepID=A0AAE1GX29_9NEOP|nr:putative ATP-dependent RNA helicase DHX34 [Frankliniella fusca]
MDRDQKCRRSDGSRHEHEATHSKYSTTLRNRKHHYDSSPSSNSQKVKRHKTYLQHDHHDSTSSSKYHEDGRYYSEKNEYPSQSYHKKRTHSPKFNKTSPGREELQDSPADFSFLNYRRELNRVFFYDPSSIQDVDDLWKFVTKYEAIQKKRSETKHFSKNRETEQLNELGLPLVFDKHDLVNINLSVKNRDLCARLPPYDPDFGDQQLSHAHISEFKKIVQLYLGFKQKENFLKLQKLRESQANLPVAQHRFVQYLNSGNEDKFMVQFDVSASRDEIVEAVKNESVVIIAGDTGCGKSTQVPQYLLKAGFNKIACTQPRRIACIALSKRVAYETLNEYGSEVGYQIRFERRKDQHTRIVFITEGLLLRQMSSDDSLSSYDVLVLDEVHERHLHGDFLLGVVKCLLHQRKDLKLVLMSATINIKLFSDYFGDAARVIQVPGRLHPIKLQYFPLSVEDRASKSERFNAMPYLRILQLIDSKYSSDERGDLLVFLSGMSEIQAVVDAAKEYNLKKKTWIVLPLHSTLSLAEQDKVFDYAPEGTRKCVVSTNIAETSITIDGIRFVVDSGKVKEMSYDPVNKMQRLKEFWISKASAEQRKGRAGRTGPGVCFRLYSEEEYQALEKYSTPELQRVPLDSLLLQMVSMGLPDARKFPFIEPPPMESIENSITSLKQQGALTSCEKLTSMGKMLARLPVDIPLGKMLIMGSLFHQAQPVLSLAAALSVQSPFTNRAFRDPECENARKSLESDHGDPVTLLNALREWLEEKNHSRGSDRSGTRVWCKRRGLEEQRFYEMTKLRAQFKDLLQDCGLLKDLEQPSEKMTSSERAIRHGELKLLRSMRREYQNAAPRKRTLLKVDPFEVCGEDEEKQGVDIKDVEFRMRNDSNQVQNLLTGSSACSYKDLMMLKVILCSGLYPQFAIADEFNYCKTTSEQLFHTQKKPYVALHPMSVFGNNPKTLQLEDSDIVTIENKPRKQPFSAKHQLITYMTLLETTKPYLVNTMRMPAAQTLLLFSQDLHTNFNFSRVVCDSWIQLDFPLPLAAETLLIKVAHIQYLWEKLLQLRLEDKETAILEQKLTEEIILFMRSEVVYSIKRLLAADLKVMYVGMSYNEEIISPNPFQEEFEAHPNSSIGGMQVTSRITYNCLLETSVDSKALEEECPWHCDRCDFTLNVSPIERLQHRQICGKNESKDGDTISQEPMTPRKPNSKAFECLECRRTYYFTPVEILKHKKQHLAGPSSAEK